MSQTNAVAPWEHIAFIMGTRNRAARNFNQLSRAALVTLAPPLTPPSQGHATFVR